MKSLSVTKTLSNELVTRDIVTTRDTRAHDNLVTGPRDAAGGGEGSAGGDAEDRRGQDEGGAQCPGQAQGGDHHQPDTDSRAENNAPGNYPLR